MNYNAFQMGLQHRLTHGLAFGSSYSHSKALGYQGDDPYHTEQWFYGPVQTNRPNLLTFNYSYQVPSPSQNKMVKAVFGGWTWAGTGVITSGAPVTPTCSSTAAFPYSDPSETGVGTNSITGVRCEVTGNLNATGQNFYNNFNTSAFSLAPIGTFGDAGVGICISRVSWSNFDTSLDKQIQSRSGCSSTSASRRSTCSTTPSSTPSAPPSVERRQRQPEHHHRPVHRYAGRAHPGAVGPADVLVGGRSS